MTVKEIYEFYPNSVFFIQGFGEGYPMRSYPSDFTTKEKKKLANMEVETARALGGNFYRYASNTIVLTVKED